MRLIYSEFNQLLDEPGSGGGDCTVISVTWLDVLKLSLFLPNFCSAESWSVPDKDLCSLL